MISLNIESNSNKLESDANLSIEINEKTPFLFYDDV